MDGEHDIFFLLQPIMINTTNTFFTHNVNSESLEALLVPNELLVPDALLGPGREPVDGVSLVHDNLSQTPFIIFPLLL